MNFGYFCALLFALAGLYYDIARVRMMVGANLEVCEDVSVNQKTEDYCE